MEITKRQFQAYEGVRRSGVTNMWDVRTVQRLSHLDKDLILEIIKRYTELAEIYPDVRNLKALTHSIRKEGEDEHIQDYQN